MDTEHTIETHPDHVYVEHEYSPFWPLAIALAAFLLWTGYQIIISYTEGATIRHDLETAQPEIAKAQTARARYISLAQDLVQTSAKDPFAAQIAKEANIQARPASTTAAPTSAH